MFDDNYPWIEDIKPQSHREINHGFVKPLQVSLLKTEYYDI